MRSDEAQSLGAVPAVIRVAARGETREIPVEAPERAIAAGELVWIDLVEPGPTAGALLADRLGLGELTVEDCLLPFRMPKFDPLADGGAFVAALAVRLEERDEPRLPAVAVALVIGPRYLVTMRRGAVPELATRLEAVLRGELELPAYSGVGLAYAALDAVVDRHLPVMLRAAEIAEDLDERLDPQADGSIAALEQLILLRRDLLGFRRLGVAQREALRRLGRAFPEVKAHLADVADDQREAADTAIATCDYIDGAVEAYRVRRELRTEHGVRRLTVLAAILGPLSLLVGLWGVNFENIPGTSASWGWYPFTGVLVSVAAFSAWYARHRGLL